MSAFTTIGAALSALLARVMAQPQPQPTPPPPKPAVLNLWRHGAPATTRPPLNPWQIARPLPGVVPDGVPSMAQDDALSGLYGFAGGSGSWSEGLGWFGYAYLSELAQRPEYRQASETIAKEMTRKWITLQSSGSDDGKAGKVRQLELAFKRYDVQGVFRRAAELDGFFGRAQIFLDTGYSNDPDELCTPLYLNESKIPHGGLKRLVVIEPMWTYPHDYDSVNPLSASFMNPRAWWVQGRQIHASRLLTLVSREMPDLLKPAYAFGGLSMSQMIHPYVENWLRTRQSVSDMLHTFSVSGLKTNMAAMMAEAGEDALFRRGAFFNQARDNRGFMMLDKDSEEYFNIAAPLGGLDHLQAQAQEQMASVARIPLVVLLGITPSGLNASSDGEIRTFYAWIEAQQQHLFFRHLTTVLHAIQLSEFGMVDPEIGFQFNPLWQLDEEKRAQVRQVDAQTATTYIQAGVLSPHEERERIARDEDSPYAALDLTEQPDPQMPNPADEADPSQEAGDDGPVPRSPSRPPPFGRQTQTRPDGAGRPAIDHPSGPGREPIERPTIPAHDSAEENDMDRPLGPGRPPIMRPRIVRPGLITMDADWDENAHTRGQPGNAGEFGSGGGGGGHSETGATKSSTKSAPAKAAPPQPAAAQTSGAETTAASAKTKRDRSTMKPTKSDGKVRTQADGSPLPAHIQALKIPPAWSDVSYDDTPGAELLATGKDAKGRPQSVYSAAFTAKQAAAKFSRIHDLMQKFEGMQAQNEQMKADPRRKEAADCLDLIMKMGVRPGSEEDTGAKLKAYGATTLEGRHVVTGADGSVSLQFVGKKGVSLNLPVHDPQLAGMLKDRAAKAGPDGQLFKVNESQLSDHAHLLNGGHFKTKDFRTHLGTKTASDLVASMPAPTDQKTYEKAIKTVAEHVSKRLGNTASVALESYISPAIFQGWRNTVFAEHHP